LSTTWENWDKLQAGYAAMKFDHMSAPDRNIQLLDADTFIASGTGDMTSSTGKVKQATMRFTDVYRRQADGKWLIVNEHVSMKPTTSGA
jgi:ketosteroid isomerase-like protein